MTTKLIAASLAAIAEQTDWTEFAEEPNLDIVYVRQDDGHWVQHRMDPDADEPVGPCGANLDDARTAPTSDTSTFSRCAPCQAAARRGEPLAELRSTDSFENAGYGRYNDGLVLRFADGSEYQITVVRSR